jgi:hypothetical protein
VHDRINVDRRRFMSTIAAVTVAGARFSVIRAESGASVSTNTFGGLKQIDADVQIADCLGLNQPIDQAHVRDVGIVSVGAGPPGRAAAVYGCPG